MENLFKYRKGMIVEFQMENEIHFGTIVGRAYKELQDSCHISYDISHFGWTSESNIKRDVTEILGYTVEENKKETN